MGKQELTLYPSSASTAGRIFMLSDEKLWEDVLKEYHCLSFTVHIGGTKMYQDLKKQYWWKGMKVDVAKFVEKCLTCQQVKIEHQKPTRKLQSLEIPE